MTKRVKDISIVIGIISGITGIIAFIIYFFEKNWIQATFALIVIIVLFVLGVYVERIGLLTRPGQIKRVKIFKTSLEAKYNFDFYNYFNERIKNARQDIYVTGDGFECKDETGKKLANSYHNATREALGNGVNIVRLQTKPFISEEWAKMLKNLLEDFPKSFSLYVYYYFEDEMQIASSCVMDVDDSDNNLIEVMFSVNRYIGATGTDLAGLAVFVEGDSQLSKDLRDRILHIINNNKRVRKVEKDNVSRMLVNKKLYFSYGSNMDETQMRERCPSAVKIGVGEIDSYKIVFNRKGTYRDGGVSSIEPAYNSKVFGVVFQMDEKELIDLDKIEDKRAYNREEIDVKLLSDGDVVRCSVYKSFRQEDIEPDQEYLDLIINAAEKANLPKLYQKELKAHKTS